MLCDLDDVCDFKIHYALFCDGSDKGCVTGDDDDDTVNDFFKLGRL